MSLIQSMGLRYFQEWFHGALFIREGKVLQVSEANSEAVFCRVLNPTTGGTSSESVPHEFFTGFKVFEYPPLGYRRVGNITHHVHRTQSAYRGLRANLLTFEYSPLTYLLQNNERTHTSQSTSAGLNKKLAAVMLPQYDTRASLDLLVAGRQASVVPNEDVCIEPSISGEDYVVLYRCKIVGTMDARKQFHINNPVVAAAVNAAFRE